jgi:hypothetical protein
MDACRDMAVFITALDADGAQSLGDVGTSLL